MNIVATVIAPKTIYGKVVSNDNGLIVFKTKRPRSSKFVTISVSEDNVISLHTTKQDDTLTYLSNVDVEDIIAKKVTANNKNFIQAVTEEGTCYINKKYIIGNGEEEVVETTKQDKSKKKAKDKKAKDKKSK